MPFLTGPLNLLLAGVSAFIVLVIAGGFVSRMRQRRSSRPRAPMFAVRLALGIIFLLLSVVGALLPVLQGWVFFGIAMLLLFPQSRFAIKALDKIEPRFPRVVRWLHRVGVGVHEQKDDHDTIAS